MRNTFVKQLTRLAQANPKIILLTGDLGFGVLDDFIAKCPLQFLNAGIAEQNMTGVAAGLAMEGFVPVTYSIANFTTLRCLEQIRNDIAYPCANVKIVSVGAGVAYGTAGFSHFATEDMAVMRAIPNLPVFSPGDPYEAEAVSQILFNMEGPGYLRLGKGGEDNVHAAPLVNYQLGRAIPLAETGAVALFATGAILSNVWMACQRLNELGHPVRCYSFPTVCPLDAAWIARIAREVTHLVTVEEHYLAGGFGGAIAEILAECPSPRARLTRIGLQRFVKEVGSQTYLREQHGLSVDAIVQRVLALKD
jgi:transketolase